MKKYIVILKNKKRDILTEDLLRGHVEHLKKLEKEGRLFLCGPFTDNEGALQIITAYSFNEAEKSALQDPFIIHGYYEYILHELIEADRSNNYLVEDKQTVNNLNS